MKTYNYELESGYNSIVYGTCEASSRKEAFQIARNRAGNNGWTVICCEEA